MPKEQSLSESIARRFVIEEEFEATEDGRGIIFNGVIYDANTSPDVIRALDAAISSGGRTRIWYGDTKTGGAFTTDMNVVGKIGRSGGQAKYPIMIASSRSLAGAKIDTDSIVAIASAPHTFSYKHPTFKPIFRYRIVEPQDGNYKSQIINLETGDSFARFKTEDGAARWVAFMLGHRMTK